MFFTCSYAQAGGREWDQKQLTFYYHKFYKNVYTAQIISYDFVTLDNKKYTYEEYQKYETMRKFLEHKIEEFYDTFSEYVEGSFKPEPFIRAKQEVLKFEKQSSESRKKLVKLYQEELKKYPQLKGYFHSKLKQSFYHF